MQSTQEFLDSLDPDLNPEEREEQLKQFSLKQEEEYKKLQSETQKGVNILTERVIEESKKINENPNYIHDLYKSDPKTAIARVKKNGGDYTEQDLIDGKPLPPKKDDFEEKMSAYKRKEETEKLSSEFIDAINLTEDEKKVFESKLKDLVGDRVLTKDQMKQAMIGVAFDMGKKLYNNREQVIMDHNAIPASSPRKQKGSEYKPHNPDTISFLESHNVIKAKPEK